MTNVAHSRQDEIMTDLDAQGWRSSLRRHDIVVFMLVALILTWVVWVPRAMGIQVECSVSCGPGCLPSPHSFVLQCFTGGTA